MRAAGGSFCAGILRERFWSRLIAAIVIGLVNGTVGMLLKILTFPLTIITFGIFWLLINALMLKFAALFVPGFEVRGLLMGPPSIFVLQVLPTDRLILDYLRPSGPPSKLLANVFVTSGRSFESVRACGVHAPVW